MSEFSRNLRITTSLPIEKAAIPEPFHFERTLYNCPLRQATKYEIQGGVYKAIWIEDSVKESGNYTYYVDQIKLGLVEFMFGEFRKPIHELRWAINERNYDKADKLLTSIERQMFEL